MTSSQSVKSNHACVSRYHVLQMLFLALNNTGPQWIMGYMAASRVNICTSPATVTASSTPCRKRLVDFGLDADRGDAQ